MPAVAFSDVTKVYRNAATPSGGFRALDGVSFAIGLFGYSLLT